MRRPALLSQFLYLTALLGVGPLAAQTGIWTGRFSQHSSTNITSGIPATASGNFDWVSQNSTSGSGRGTGSLTLGASTLQATRDGNLWRLTAPLRASFRLRGTYTLATAANTNTDKQISVSGFFGNVQGCTNPAPQVFAGLAWGSTIQFDLSFQCDITAFVSTAQRASVRSRVDIAIQSGGVAVDADLVQIFSDYVFSQNEADLAIVFVQPVQVVHNFPPREFIGPAGVDYKVRELPFIARRPTVIRVWIKNLTRNGTAVDNVTAVLRGSFINGSGVPYDSPNPLNPITAPITVQPYSGPVPRTVPPDYGEPTVDFQLPDAWVANPGGYSYRVELVLPPGANDPDLRNNTVTNTIAIQKQPRDLLSANENQLVVGYIPVCSRVPGVAVPSCPSTRIGEMSTFVTNTFPISTQAAGTLPAGLRYFRADNIYRELPGTIQRQDQIELWKASTLRPLYYRLSESTPMDYLVAFITDVTPRTVTGNCPGVTPVRTPPCLRGGDSDPQWADGDGNVVVVTDYFPQIPAAIHHTGTWGLGFSTMNVAHELGHVMGLEHVSGTMTGCPANAPGFACPNWPYLNPSIQFPGYMPGTPPTYLAANQTFDVMSYCGNPDASNMWVSPFTFRWLFDQNLAPSDRPLMAWNSCKLPPAPLPNAVDPGKSPRAANASQLRGATPTQYLLVTGTVRRDASIGTMDAAFRITTSRLPRPSISGGNHCLRFLDAGGAALGDHCFNLSFRDLDNQILDTEAFSVLVTPPPGVARVALVRGGATLASLSGGERPPTVNFTSPRPGESWTGGPQTIQWSGTGSGSAPLAFILDYSADGGVTWMPLTTPGAASRFTLDSSELPGGSNIFFRVQASDGIQTAEARVGPITVSQAPRAAAAPTSLDFRNSLVAVGVSRKLQLTNEGTGPLRISGVESTSSAFQLVSPSLPYTLAVRDSVTLEVRFVPPGLGRVSGALRITSNASDNPVLSINLTGNGISAAAPDVAVTPAPVDFGSIPAGTNASRDVTVQNFGPAPLSVTSYVVAGPGFALAEPAASFTLAANATRTIAIRFTGSGSGPQAGTLTLVTNDPANPNLVVALRANVTPPSGGSTAPRVAAGGIVHGASFTAGLSRGALATVFGELLANPPAQSAASVPWPRSLAGARVLVGGVEAPIYFASPSQINFQVPFEVPLGSVPVTVVRDGIESAVQQVSIADFAPGLFTYARTATDRDPIVVHLTGQLVTPASPAAPGETLIGFLTGIGSLTNSPRTGEPSPASPLAQATAPTVITLGGVAAESLFNGLTPGFIGLVQINFTLPRSLPAGSLLPLRIRVGSAAAPDVNLAVVDSQAGAPPRISIQPGLAEFGSVAVGSASTTVINVSNQGEGTLNVSSITSSNPMFSISPSGPFSVAPGGRTPVTVRFAPSAAGAQAGILTFVSNDPASSRLAAPVSGTGIAANGPRLSTAPASINFGSVQGGAFATVPLTLFNNGNAALTISSIASSNARFTVSPSGPFTLPSATLTEVIVRFSPVDGSGQSGVLTIASNDPVQPSFQVAVSGNGGSGGSPNPRIAVSPASLAFGTVAAGASAQLPVTIANNGTAPLTVSALSISNALFTVTPAAPLTIPAGGSTQVSVRFSPTAAGAQSGTLTVTSNDSTQPSISVALSGTGGASSGSGPEAWWKFDEGVGGSALDASGNGNTATLRNGAAWAPGLRGSALSLDGVDDFADAGTTVRLVSPVFTVEAWIKGDPLGMEQWARIVDTGFASGFAFGRYGTSQQVSFEFRGSAPVTSPFVVIDNAWHHVVVVKSGATAALYEDGVFRASGPVNADASVSTLPLFIGFNPGEGIPGHWKGLIDEVRIYSRALTDAEIAANYEALKPVAVPRIGVSPTSLSFGSVTADTSATLSLSVSNTGSAPLNVTSLTSSNPAFTVTPSAPFTVPAGSSSALTVRFSPAAAGAQTGILTLASNDAAQPSIQVALSGTGTPASAPRIGVSPTSLNFGSVTAGSSATLSLTIANTGNATLTVTGLTASNALFTVTPAAPLNILAGSSAQVTVRFSPVAAGSQSGTLTVASNDASQPSLPVTLSGTGLAAPAPRIGVSPASMSFGSVTVGVSASLSLTVSNTGTASLSVSGISSSNALFTFTPAAPLTIAAGSSAILTVRFSPTAAGAQSGTLTITSSDPAQPSSLVSLSGTGTVPTGGADAYWRFDEGSGTNAADATGNGITATLTNGAGWTTGIRGTALNLDGVDDYADAGTLLRVGSTFTIEGWIKGDPSMEIWGRILDSGYASGYALGRYGDSKYASFEFLGSPVLVTAKTVIDNNWHHIVVVKSGSTATMYADGLFQNSVTVNAGGPTGTQPVFIGYNSGEGTRGHWKGQLDELHVYSRALTETEILANYNALQPAATSIANPLAYWRFDEASGVFAADASGRGYTATLLNGATRAAGIRGNALSLDGLDDYANLAAGFAVSTSNFTLEAWIKGDPSMEAYGRILDSGYNSGFSLGRDGGSRRLLFEFKAMPIATTSDVVDNTWHHVAVVKSGGTAVIYVDGAAEGSISTLNTGAPANTLPTLIGYNPGEGTRGHWKGLLDEVRAYDRALTASEIQSNYNARGR